MSDDSEIWESVRKEGQAKRWQNLENSLHLLKSRGIEVKQFSESHYRVGVWDFWPTTGKFRNPKTGQGGRGVFNLIKKL